MVFVMFEKEGGGQMLFVGADLKSVLDDTHGGSEFGFSKLTSQTTLTEKEARATGARYLDDGIEGVSASKTASYCADTSLPL
jgi:hypothetical protein